MKRVPQTIFIVIALLLAIAPAATAQPPAHERFIVVLHEGAGPPEAVASEVAQRTGGRVGHVYTHALEGFSIELPASAVAALQNDPRVNYFERDLEAHTLEQTIPTGVDRINAELNATASIDGQSTVLDVDVAIIDTGIDVDHPDLQVHTECVRYYTVNSGPPWQRGSFEDENCDDDNGHGTHVAGTVAALDNDIGVVGVAPGATLWAVKVLDANGSGSFSDVIAGVDWVTARADQIEVANMSLGGQGQLDSLRTAIQNSVNAGVVYAVAAGNSSMDIYGDGNFATLDDNYIPASYPEAATISALADFDGKPGGEDTTTSFTFSSCTEAEDDSFACFSNYSTSVVGGNPVTSPGAGIDLMLPGVNIYSTYMNGGYAHASGTSMASPHAAGLAALYILDNGRATDHTGVYAIRQALIDSGWDQNSADGLATFDDRDNNPERLGTAAAGNGGGDGDTNSPPTASFTYTCTDLACDFDGSGSSDSDGSISSYDWDFGDGATASGQTASHTYASDGTYTVTLTVTDDGGATDADSQSVSVSGSSSDGISLSVSAYKIKGTQHADLTWSGATSTNVDVYRDGVVVATTANDGAHTDITGQKGGGTATYKVCEAGTTTCSNEATATW